MRLSVLILVVGLAAAPAFAGNDPVAEGTVTEIRLGKAPAPPPAVDPTRVRAVERFLAARQAASMRRASGRATRLAVSVPKGATSDDLYGPPKSRLVAFDFKNASIEPSGRGRFSVTVYVLFADGVGEIVESRNERLTFAGTAGVWSCVKQHTATSMAWESEPVATEAKMQGLAEALTKAQAHLKSWTAGPRPLAYSVADVSKSADGRVVVSCLRFSAESGRRGFDVQEDPVVLSGDRGNLRVESN